jgi:hypothetical protein
VVIAVDEEELRVDRAVKVSKKELNLLVAELFDCADMMSSDDEDVKTQQQESHLLPEKDESVEVEVSVTLMKLHIPYFQFP